jgi:hypothetical protein
MSGIMHLNAMMKKFDIVRDDKIEITTRSNGDVYSPVAGRLFYGEDRFGRMFVNLPLAVKLRLAGMAAMTHEIAAARLRGRNEPVLEGKTVFVVFQRYPTVNLFQLQCGRTTIPHEQFLGETFDNLDSLEKLLAGGTVRLYDGDWSAGFGGVTQLSKTCWMDVELLHDTMPMVL